MHYELLYLVGISKEPEMETIKKDVSDIVMSEGGIFHNKLVIEKRKLAYKVKHENQGFYVAQRFDIEDTTRLQAITKKLNLNTNILRSLITRADELPELISREERKEKEAKKSKRLVTKETKSSQEKTADKKASEEDIDKKLEEILNI
jgi:small subunit ribosomal protein S6